MASMNGSSFDIGDTLGLLEERLGEARVLPAQAGGREALGEAIARARAQLAGQPPQILTIALAGGTGSGKSTLINALAGAPIAIAGARRPTTDRIHVYHHREVPRAGLPAALAEQAVFIAHDREELRNKVIVDTPDLDSFIREHRTLTLELLKAAGLVLYVFTSEKYLNADILSVVREEQRFSHCAAILNKIDLLPNPGEIDQLTADLRGRFAAIGQPSIRVYRTCARQHAGAPGTAVADGETVGMVRDDFAALRQLIEQELRAGDIERMRQLQQARVLINLEEQVDRIAPPDLGTRLDRFMSEADDTAGQAASHLCAALAPRLNLVDAELAPLAVIAQHQRFWGPFRAWLAASDFIRFGLAGLARRFAGGAAPADARGIERLLGADAGATVGATLKTLAQRLQDTIYHAGLPLEHWRQVTARHEPESAAGELAEEIRGLYLTGALARRGGRMSACFHAGSAHLLSALGTAATVGLAGLGLFHIVRETITGQFGGVNVVGHIVAVLVLSFALLQLVGDLVLVRRPRLGRQTGARAIGDIVRQWSGRWTTEYQQDIEREWRLLRAPVEELRTLLEHRPAAQITHDPRVLPDTETGSARDSG